MKVQRKCIFIISSLLLTISCFSLFHALGAEANALEKTDQQKRISQEIILHTKNETDATIITDIIHNVSEKTGIDEAYLAAMMEVESNFNMEAEDTVNDSYGLMQVNIRQDGITKTQLKNPYENTLYAAKVLKQYQEIFKEKPKEQQLQMMAYAYFGRMKHPIKEKTPVAIYIENVMKKYHELK